jgi:hypothetical protein
MARSVNIDIEIGGIQFHIERDSGASFYKISAVVDGQLYTEITKFAEIGAGQWPDQHINSAKDECVSHFIQYVPDLDEGNFVLLSIPILRSKSRHEYYLHPDEFDQDEFDADQDDQNQDTSDEEQH